MTGDLLTLFDPDALLGDQAPPAPAAPDDLSDLDFDHARRVLAAEVPAVTKFFKPTRAPHCRCPRPLPDDDRCIRCGRLLEVVGT